MKIKIKTPATTVQPPVDGGESGGGTALVAPRCRLLGRIEHRNLWMILSDDNAHGRTDAILGLVHDLGMQQCFESLDRRRLGRVSDDGLRMLVVTSVGIGRGGHVKTLPGQ